MRGLLKYILPFAALVLSACIKNDVPYPVIVPAISDFQVEGSKSVDINYVTQNITIYLEEGTDIQKVKINTLEFADQMTKCKPSMTGSWNLDEPQNFTFSNYRDYGWTLKAVQDIERYFNVGGQVGATVIDIANRRVLLNVSKKVKLDEIEVKSMKLGPEGIATYSKSMEQITNLENGETVDVTAHGRTETWFILAEQVASSIDLKAVNPWTKVAWLEANGIDGEDNGFCYRKLGSSDWTVLDKSKISFDGGFFRGCVDGLEPLTAYECYAYSGDETTSVEGFTTEGTQELPNGGLNVYSNAESSKYKSFFDPAHSLWSQKWWDSGNVASTAVGESGVICSPDTEDQYEGDACARLTSRFVVVKFAAGNLFCGEFTGMVGTKGGIVNFGRPWTTRPRSIKVMMKSVLGPMDYVDKTIEGKNIKLGDPDINEIYVALGDWDYRKYGGTPTCPVRVNTADHSTDFDPNSEAIIAYGHFETSKSVGEWTELEIPLEYRSYSRKPTHIVINCAASKYGDYFTGCSNTIMWLDDFKVEY